MTNNPKPGFLKSPAPLFTRKKPRQAVTVSPNRSGSFEPDKSGYGPKLAAPQTSYQQAKPVAHRPSPYPLRPPSSYQNSCSNPKVPSHIGAGFSDCQMLSAQHLGYSLAPISGVHNESTNGRAVQPGMRMQGSSFQTYNQQPATGLKSPINMNNRPQRMPVNNTRSPMMTQRAQYQQPRGIPAQQHQVQGPRGQSTMPCFQGGPQTQRWQTGVDQKHAQLPTPGWQNTRPPQQGMQSYGKWQDDRVQQTRQQQSYSRIENNGWQPSTDLMATTENIPGVSQSKFKIVTTNDAELNPRIVTAAIKNVKEWAKFNNKIPLVFELFACVDSAVSLPDQFSRCTFSVRDETDILTCVFFQIDRELPRLTRGQTYRLMGKFSCGKNEFQCLTIRQASSDEKKVYRVFIGAAQQAVNKCIKQSCEF